MTKIMTITDQEYELVKESVALMLDLNKDALEQGFEGTELEEYQANVTKYTALVRSWDYGIWADLNQTYYEVDIGIDLSKVDDWEISKPTLRELPNVISKLLELYEETSSPLETFEKQKNRRMESAKMVMGNLRVPKRLFSSFLKIVQEGGRALFFSLARGAWGEGSLRTRGTYPMCLLKCFSHSEDPCKQKSYLPKQRARRGKTSFIPLWMVML